MNDQFTPLVFVRLAYEYGAGHIRAQRFCSPTGRNAASVCGPYFIPTAYRDSVGAGIRRGKNEISGLFIALHCAEQCNLRGVLREFIGLIGNHILLDDVMRVGAFAVDELRPAAQVAQCSPTSAGASRLICKNIAGPMAR